MADVVDGDDLQAVVGAELFEGLDGAVVAAAEAHIAADGDELGAQPADEVVVDELLSGLVGEVE